MYVRKALHLMFVALVVLSTFFAGLTGALVSTSVLLCLVLAARRLGFLRSVRSSEQRSEGDLLLPLGLMGAALIAFPDNPPAFYFSAIIVGCADPAAAFSGRLIRSRAWHYAGERRSTAGSAAFFLIALTAARVFGSTPFEGVFLASVLTVVEIFSIRGSDNLSLPLMSALLFKSIGG